VTEKAITFEDLGFAYNQPQWVLRGYHAYIERGKVFAILGPNGCGKTTLLKLLVGALHPQEGKIYHQDHFAFVPQLFQVSFSYTVLDMVLMGRVGKIKLFSTPSAKDEEAALDALSRLKLDHLEGRPFDELSGGQRQLVIFARALATEANILVLDEPTSSLDLKNQGVILEWIMRLSHEENLTVIFTTHHPHHAYAVADTTMLMLGEHEFLCGPTRDVMTEERLQALYGVDMKRLQFEHKGRVIETFVPVYGTQSQCDGFDLHNPDKKVN
jgi:iron complex transport system ATP-binding protein